MRDAGLAVAHSASEGSPLRMCSLPPSRHKCQAGGAQQEFPCALHQSSSAVQEDFCDGGNVALSMLSTTAATSYVGLAGLL